MRRKFLPLFECPYCARGEVLVDPHAVHEYLATPHDHLYVHEESQQKVFRFHSEHGVDRPCPHLFLLSGSVELRRRNARVGRIDDSFDFDFNHPLHVEAIRGNEAAEYAFWDGVIVGPVAGVRVLAEYLHDYFETRWQNVQGDAAGLHFAVSGQYLVVANADDFVAALPAFAATYGQALST